jgi:predicted transcriptional regulator
MTMTSPVSPSPSLKAARAKAKGEIRIERRSLSDITPVAVSNVPGQAPETALDDPATPMLRLGVASRDTLRARTLAIAQGILKPAPDDPKVWVESLHALGLLLSNANITLLNTIRETQPPSISALALITGRRQGNLSRTLNNMARHGLVTLVKEGAQVRPTQPITRVHVDLRWINQAS